MNCEDLEPLIEALADASREMTPEIRAHLASCERCAASLEHAEQIERWLAARDVPRPSANFTASVMMRVRADAWRTERVVDLGFNLAIAAGLLVIVGAGAGLAWSLGFLQVHIDFDLLRAAATSRVEDHVINELQTMLIAAALLFTALTLWWWAEHVND